MSVRSLTCFNSWSARIACSEGIVDRLDVSVTNKLFSFSESGHGFVWEACCPEHECQCPGHTGWLYTRETCRPEHECQCPGHTIWLYTREACPEHECQCPGHSIWLYTREACPEHECQCPGRTGWLYTCCMSRTTQWISTRVFMPEWSSLSNVDGRILICPYYYLALKSGLIFCLKETNCCVRLIKQMFKSAAWRKLFYVWVTVGDRQKESVMCSCV